VTIGVSHDLDTGTVVLVVKAERTIYDFSPERARTLADELRQAARAGGSVLIVATAEGGRQIRVGGDAAAALVMAADIDRNAELAQALRD
jgi:hypothetical protein